MTRSVAAMTLIFLALSPPLGAQGLWDDPGPLFTKDGTLVPTVPPLPAWDTSPKALPGQKDMYDTYRLNNIDYYLITDPPARPVRSAGEFEEAQALILSWTPGTFDDYYVTMITTALGRAPIYMFHNGRAQRTWMEEQLQWAGVPASHFTNPAYFVWIDAPYETVWVRDSGPNFVLDQNDTVSIIDARYYHERVMDDAIPTNLDFGVNIYRPSIEFEGGNFMASGDGLCFSSIGIQWNNMPEGREWVRQIYQDYFGCETTEFFQPLSGEGTTHIDMQAKLLTPNDIIVGYDAYDEDCVNGEIMDANAELAASMGLVVHRIPMPSHADGVWRTYTNSLTINNLVMVPTYNEDRTFEAQALGVYQAVLGPDWDVVAIPSDDVIRYGGSVHCTTMTAPAGRRASMETPPGDLCGMTYSCELNSGCGTVDFTGYCDGNVAVWCESNQVVTYPCDRNCSIFLPPDEPCEMGCGWVNSEDYYFCNGEPLCQGADPCWHECDPGSIGCSADGLSRYTCGEANDGDDCLDQMLVACSPGQSCQNGQCVGSGCFDECDPGEVGCFSGLIRWHCGEGGDGDACLDVVTVSCGADEVCLSGACVPDSTCQDECDSGEVGCLDPATAYSCGEAGDGDACLEMLTEDCGLAMECSRGNCVSTCMDDCDTGEMGCSPDFLSYWVCGEADDGDLCREPVFEACGADELCQGGECLPDLVCVDECLGWEVGCSGDHGSSWFCGEEGDGDDCLEEIYVPCPQGEICLDGECLPETVCTDECLMGEVGCSWDGRSEWICGEAGDGDECLDRIVWPCGAQEVCEEESCLPIVTCQDQCQAGEIGCSPDGLSRWFCAEAGDGDDCLDQIQFPCDATEACEAGLCMPVTTCSDECRGGETGCEGGGTRWYCGEDDDGDECLDRIAVACGPDQRCEAGVCVAGGCSDECGQGEAGCTADKLSRWFCGDGDDGDDCLDRVNIPCVPGQICASGVCMEDTTCTDECSSGERGCQGAGSRWSCGEAGDGDGCMERLVTSCPAGTECLAGSCDATCDDECGGGETGCLSSTERWTCGDGDDGDVCLDRVGSACPAGERCDGGACVPEGECHDECQAGSTGCTADEGSRWTCIEAGDGDDCLERHETSCGGGEICQEGLCVPELTCQDECAVGTTGCAGGGTRRWSCGEADDGDSCLDRIEEPCSEGEACSAGDCIADSTCGDECNGGETGCVGGDTAWACGEAGDGDACLDRVSSPCPEGTSCAAGECLPDLTCVDECEVGQRGCIEGSNMSWECGQKDNDPCLEPVTHECGANLVCLVGECTPEGSCLDDCEPGEGGCVDGATAWTCGEGDDGDACLEMLEQACGQGQECVEGECKDQAVSCQDECLAGSVGCSDDLLSVWTCGEVGDGDGCLEPVIQPCGAQMECLEGVCGPLGPPVDEGTYKSKGSSCSLAPSGQGDAGVLASLMPLLALGWAILRRRRG